MKSIFNSKEVWRNSLFKVFERTSEYGNDFCVFIHDQLKQEPVARLGSLEEAKEFCKRTIYETYKASVYAPEKVTGKYVRVEGKKSNYRFKVFETTGTNGQGATLREYITSGAELPQDLKERCIKSKSTEKWA